MSDFENQAKEITDNAIKDAQTLVDQTIYGQKRREYSKIIVAAVLIGWACFGAYCAIVWLLRMAAPMEILGYATGIVATALGGYFAKAGYQNGKAQEGTNELTLKAMTIAQSTRAPSTRMERGENI